MPNGQDDLTPNRRCNYTGIQKIEQVEHALTSIGISLQINLVRLHWLRGWKRISFPKLLVTFPS